MHNNIYSQPAASSIKYYIATYMHIYRNIVALLIKLSAYITNITSFRNISHVVAEIQEGNRRNETLIEDECSHIASIDSELLVATN